MNFKKISIIVITIISIFSFNNKVDAAQELTCFYQSTTNNKVGILLRQHKDGSLKLFYGFNADDIYGNVWYYVGKKSANEQTIEMLATKQFKMQTIIENSSLNKDNQLESCPKYRYESEGKYAAILSDKTEEDLYSDSKHSYYINDEKYKSIKSGIAANLTSYENNNNRIHYMNPTSQYNKNGDGWFMPTDEFDLSCLYMNSSDEKPFNIGAARVQIDMNETEIRVNSSYNNSQQMVPGEMSGNVIFNYISSKLTRLKTDGNTTCPATINLYIDDDNSPRINIMWGSGQNGDHLDDAEHNYTFILAKTSKDGEDTSKPEITYTNISKITSCEDILTDEIVKYIRIVLNLIRIGIPIIIFALTTVDLSKAIFNGEEEMKKVKNKIIKRLIIAAAFFLVPTLLKVFLDIVSFIWPNIDPSLCGIFK